MLSTLHRRAFTRAGEANVGVPAGYAMLYVPLETVDCPYPAATEIAFTLVFWVVTKGAVYGVDAVVGVVPFVV